MTNPPRLKIRGLGSGGQLQLKKKPLVPGPTKRGDKFSGEVVGQASEASLDPLEVLVPSVSSVGQTHHPGLL